MVETKTGNGTALSLNPKLVFRPGYKEFTMPWFVATTAILRYALIGGIFLMLAACGEYVEEGSASTFAEIVFCETSSSLFSPDLVGQCRTSPATMGALEVR